MLFEVRNSCFRDIQFCPWFFTHRVEEMLGWTEGSVHLKFTMTSACHVLLPYHWHLLYAMTNLDSLLKSRDITLLTKVPLVEVMVFPVVMYGCELDHKEGWVPKNWCFWTVVLEKTLESSLDNKEIKPVNPKENQSWIFIGRTDAEAEASILWPSDVKSRLIGKYPGAGKDWRQEEKGATKDEMFGWHHRLNEHESEQALGECEGQWSLECLQLTGSQRTEHNWVSKQQNDR